MVQNVDQYFKEGCLRCKYGASPKCKVHKWTKELITLRSIALAAGLNEEIKWSIPIYTYNGKNVIAISALVSSANISFFKGVLLNDEYQILEKQGNIHESRIIKFTNYERIIDLHDVIKNYIYEAIEIEKSGIRAPKNQNKEPIPEELMKYFENDKLFKEAFYKLTPGRQRGYLIYFSQPKQSKTRIDRIEKHRLDIFKGCGINDLYKSKKHQIN